MFRVLIYAMPVLPLCVSDLSESPPSPQECGPYTVPISPLFRGLADFPSLELRSVYPKAQVNQGSELWWMPLRSFLAVIQNQYV